MSISLKDRECNDFFWRQGHRPHDDDDEEEDDEVEDNKKDDDNNNKDNSNDKGISALGLDRDLGFSRGRPPGTPQWS